MCRADDTKIVVIFEWGRLGNQLFQYAALMKAAPRAQILTVGMRSLAEWLKESKLMQRSFAKTVCQKLLRTIGRRRLLKLAGRGRLFSLIAEQHKDSRSLITFEEGFFAKIAVFNGFFQSQEIVVNVSDHLFAIDSNILNDAKEWINSQTSYPYRHCYFVHVRRGDYLYWPSPEEPAALSGLWYQEQIEYILKIDALAQFFIFSDDISFSQKLLDIGPNICISKGSEMRDLAAMSLCQGGGILSASTFAWWGAYYAKQNNPKALFIAPRYWFGWRKSQWNPPSIETSWIQYVKSY